MSARCRKLPAPHWAHAAAAAPAPPPFRPATPQLPRHATDASDRFFGYVRLRLQPWTHFSMVLSHMHFKRRSGQRTVALRHCVAAALVLASLASASPDTLSIASAQTP